MLYMMPGMHALREKFRPGDVAWACSFDPKSKAQPDPRMVRPVRGEFCSLSAPDGEKAARLRPEARVRYFVPYGPRGELDFVRAFSRPEDLCYADCEHECVALFNDLVDRALDRAKLVEKALEESRAEEPRIRRPGPVTAPDGRTATLVTGYDQFIKYVRPFLRTRPAVRSDNAGDMLLYNGSFVTNADLHAMPEHVLFMLPGTGGYERLFAAPCDALRTFPGLRLLTR